MHYKKISSSTLYENSKSYLIYSDKFGEIYIKDVSDFSIDSNSSKIMYGHSDPIHFLSISPNNRCLVSCDTWGKIKVLDFPNVFNLQSVIMYKNNDIKFCDFLNDKQLLVLNSNNTIHIWSLDNFVQIAQLENQLNDIEINSIIPFNEKFIYIETKSKYIIYNLQDNKLILKKEIEKSSNSVCSFLISQKQEIIAFDKLHNLNKILI